MTQTWALAAAARRLNNRAPGVPALWFFTDPVRTPDPLAVAARLPRGTAVVYRHFGAPNRLETARKLATLSRRRGLVLLIGADPALAASVRAHGVHLPERLAHKAGRLRRQRPHWLISAAAHAPDALRRARAAHVAVLAPVLPSRSPSAQAAIGAAQAGRWARTAPLPVVALGGVHARTARQLTRRGFAGLAAVDAFSVD